jgi:hypothetical protein
MREFYYIKSETGRKSDSRMAIVLSWMGTSNLSECKTSSNRLRTTDKVVRKSEITQTSFFVCLFFAASVKSTEFFKLRKKTKEFSLVMNGLKRTSYEET